MHINIIIEAAFLVRLGTSWERARSWLGTSSQCFSHIPRSQLGTSLFSNWLKIGSQKEKKKLDLFTCYKENRNWVGEGVTSWQLWEEVDAKTVRIEGQHSEGVLSEKNCDKNKTSVNQKTTVPSIFFVVFSLFLSDVIWFKLVM